MISSLESAFVRPPRQAYYAHDLGAEQFTVKSRFTNRTHIASRTEVKLPNIRNHELSLSFFQLEGLHCNNCIIYLHTHHGSKLEGTPLSEPMLSAHINVCLFDFGGYGNSQGDTVTLGIQESQDINTVITYLQREHKQQNFVLWGRSMGAVASIIYLSRNISHPVVAAVFDSPFSSLQKLTLQLGARNIGLPETLLKPFIFIMKRNLKEKIDFQKLQLLDIVSKITIPGLFIASKSDQFVSHQHSEDMYSRYGGEKQLLYIDKDHNQPRRNQQLTEIFTFVISKFGHSVNKQRKVNEIISRHLSFIDENSETGQFPDYFKRPSESRPLDNPPKITRISDDHLFNNKKKSNHSKVEFPRSISKKLVKMLRHTHSEQ